MVPNQRRQRSSQTIVADQNDPADGFLAAEVSPSQHVQPPEWLDMKALTRYACVSERTIREWIHLPVSPLPAYQVGRKLLFRRSTFDHWLEAHPFKSADAVDISCIVNDVLIGLGEAS
ncbi:MAG: helix-turn-helix domain-containing protein [Acidobacteriaceae bacterium]|nr:helix-turn-helix domain-containing protein [Acidobacteriaceae bacterium]